MTGNIVNQNREQQLSIQIVRMMNNRIASSCRHAGIVSLLRAARSCP